MGERPDGVANDTESLRKTTLELGAAQWKDLSISIEQVRQLQLSGRVPWYCSILVAD